MQSIVTKLHNSLYDFSSNFSSMSFCAFLKHNDEYTVIFNWNLSKKLSSSELDFYSEESRHYNSSVLDYKMIKNSQMSFRKTLVCNIETNREPITLVFLFDEQIQDLTKQALNVFFKIQQFVVSLYYEEELKTREKVNQLMFDTLPMAVFISNISGQIIQVNKYAEELTGYSSEELRGFSINQLTKSNESGDDSINISEVRQAEQLLFGTVLISKDLSQIQISANSQFVSVGNRDFFISYVVKLEDKELAKKEVFQKVIETQNNERKRFSQDLHDGLGPLLSLAKLYASDLSSSDIGTNDHDEIVAELIQIIDESVKTTRRIANNLVPSVLKEYGLLNAIKEFIGQIQKNNRVQVHIDDKGKNTLDLNAQMEIYQIIRELLNNTLKHAQASLVNLSFDFRKGGIHFIYKDDGVGFDIKKMSKESKGMGLNNISSRVDVLKGKIIMKSSLGEGLLVDVKI